MHRILALAGAVVAIATLGSGRISFVHVPAEFMGFPMPLLAVGGAAALVIGALRWM